MNILYSGTLKCKTNQRERERDFHATRDEIREICVCPHTNANTNATCEMLFPVARLDCGSDAKTAAT